MTSASSISDPKFHSSNIFNSQKITFHTLIGEELIISDVSRFLKREGTQNRKKTEACHSEEQEYVESNEDEESETDATSSGDTEYYKFDNMDYESPPCEMHNDPATASATVARDEVDLILLRKELAKRINSLLDKKITHERTAEYTPAFSDIPMLRKSNKIRWYDLAIISGMSQSYKDYNDSTDNFPRTISSNSSPKDAESFFELKEPLSVEDLVHYSGVNQLTVIVKEVEVVTHGADISCRTLISHTISQKATSELEGVPYLLKIQDFQTSCAEALFTWLRDHNRTKFRYMVGLSVTMHFREIFGLKTLLGKCQNLEEFHLHWMGSFAEVDESWYESWSSLLNILRKNTIVERLFFYTTPFGEHASSKISNWLKSNDSTLLEMFFKGCSFSEAFVKDIWDALKHNKSLHHLTFTWGRTDMSDKEMKFIAEGVATNESLRTLNISRNFCNEIQVISDEGADYLGAALRENKTLEELYLHDNQIGYEGAKSIARGLCANETLKILDLEGNQMNSQGAFYIGELLQKNKNLEKLLLSSNNFCEDGAAHIAMGLSDNKVLIELSMRDNELNPTAVASLSEALKKNQSLEKLDLGSNQFGDNCAFSIAGALTSNETLLVLKLDNNEIGHVGASSISEALRLSNCSLQDLSFANNKIGPAGTTSFAESLCSNETLRNLDLSGNQIGKSGAFSIGEALQKNQKLEKLNLGDNELGDEEAVFIAEGLSLNHKLLHLNLNCNEFGYRGISSIFEVLKGHENLEEFSIAANSKDLSDEMVMSIANCLQCNETLKALSHSSL